MDAHYVGRGQESIEVTFYKIQAFTLAIGISNDLLFPLSEQQFIANNIPGARLESIDSFYGHDGFLLEFEKIEKLIKDALVVSPR